MCIYPYWYVQYQISIYVTSTELHKYLWSVCYMLDIVFPLERRSQCAHMGNISWMKAEGKLLLAGRMLEGSKKYSVLRAYNRGALGKWLFNEGLGWWIEGIQAEFTEENVNKQRYQHGQRPEVRGSVMCSSKQMGSRRLRLEARKRPGEDNEAEEGSQR